MVRRCRWCNYGLLFVLLSLSLLGGGCTRSRIDAPTAATTPLASVAAAPSNPRAAVTGQTIYVPVYSHIYYQDRERVINLTVTLSVRNADPDHAIWLDSVAYYDANGQLVRNDVTEPRQLAPLAAQEFVVEEDDTTGGTSASFLVRWSSDEEAIAPVVEAVMISAASTQGISFVSVGRVIESFSGTSDSP